MVLLRRQCFNSLQILFIKLSNIISNFKMREKSAEGSSEGDRTFDFKYKIDLSDRRGKTGETFKQQSGFDFEDFKDFRQDNKTQKSEIFSQKKWLPSDLVKKSDQSMIIPENPTELSIRKPGGSFIAENRSRESFDGEKIFISQGASPKFSDHKFYQTISHSNLQKISKQEMGTSMNQKSKLGTKFTMPISIDEVDQKSPNRFTSPKFNDKGITSLNISNSRNKQPSSSRFSPQAEYKDICNSILYYQNQNDKIDYEMMKLMMEVQKYKNMLEDNPSLDFQIQKLTQQTNDINSQISNQRSVQKTLIQSKKNVEEEFDQIAQSIDCLRFERPAIIRDQTKAIIDQINSLKSQFDSLRRDEGSLNFSTSLMNQIGQQQPPQQNRLPGIPLPIRSPAFNPEQTLMNQAKQQILESSKNRVNFVYNIKMMIIRDEWKMYEDNQICVTCSTRDYPILEVRIGNKSVKNFGSFTIKEGGNVIADKEVLQAKCYYVHSIRMNKISQPFMKLQLSYTLLQALPQPPQPSPSSQKRVTLFLPTVPLKHGQFIPITQKQYQQQSSKHRNLLQESESLEKPIDTSIIHESLKQLALYFPHLLYEINEKGEEICKGIFRLWNSNEGAIVKIRKKNNTIDIKVRNNVSFLLGSLEFLFTLLL